MKISALIAASALTVATLTGAAAAQNIPASDYTADVRADRQQYSVVTGQATREQGTTIVDTQSFGVPGHEGQSATAGILASDYWADVQADQDQNSVVFGR